MNQATTTDNPTPDLGYQRLRNGDRIREHEKLM
jgi:hypothetical protein